jgi:hypothetical protein
MVGSQVELMEIPYFSGDKDKNEINPMEWLRMIRKTCKTPFGVSNYFYGEAQEWWMSIDKDTR